MMKEKCLDGFQFLVDPVRSALTRINRQRKIIDPCRKPHSLPAKNFDKAYIWFETVE
jgi:hypothetical protein